MKRLGEKVARQIDKELGLPPSTAANYYILRGIDYMSNPTSYSRYELEYFKENRWSMKYKDIADHLGVSEERIINMTYNLGLQTKFEWTPDKIVYVTKRLDRGESIEDIKKYYRRPEGSLVRMLNKQGLYGYAPHSYSSRNIASKPEEYIIDYLNNRFGINIPEKNGKNRDYFLGGDYSALRN